MIIKSELRVGEWLFHAYLGPVLFDTVCAVLENREGKPDTLFICHDHEYKEVTLDLVSRHGT